MKLITKILLLLVVLFFGFAGNVQAAAPNLNTLVPTDFNSQSGTVWSPTTVGNIDEGIAGATGDFIVAGVNSIASIFYGVTNVPSDFVKMITLNYDIRYQITPLSNDTEVLYVRVYKSDLTTPLTDEMPVVSTTTALTIRNKGSTSFTGVSTTATKADWDGAVFLIRTTHSASGQKDASVWSIDAFEMTGTYQLTPTVALSTPTDTQTVTSTPDLVFTGTDINSDEIEYQVQVDTVGTFDGQIGPMDSYDPNSDGSAIDTGRNFSTGVGGTVTIGQAFTGNGGYITSVKFYLKRTLNPSGTMNAVINNITGSYGTTAVGDGGTLATSNTVNAIDIPTGYTLTEFTFATPFLTTNGAYYFVGITAPTVDTSNYITVGGDISSPTHNGNESYNASIGGWFASDNIDVLFNVISTGPLLDVNSIDDTGFAGSGHTGNGWPSGNAVTYTVQSPLPADTYFWRVRGKDPLGTNEYGAWSDVLYPWTFTVPGPTKVVFTNAGRTLTAGGCNGDASVLTMQLQDAGGTPTNPTGSTVIRVSSNSTGYTIYSDNTCATPVTNGDFTFTTGQNTKSVYIIDTKTPSWTMTAAKQSGPDSITDGTQGITVNAGTLDNYLVTVSTPQTAGTCFTGTNTITARDQYNNTRTQDNTSVVNMTTTGTSMTFYSGAGCSGLLGAPYQYTMSSGQATMYIKTTQVQSGITVTATKDGGAETGTSGAITVDVAGNPIYIKIKGGTIIKGGTKIGP